MSGLNKVIGVTAIVLSIMSPASHAHLKNHPLRYAGSTMGLQNGDTRDLRSGSVDFYSQVKELLGEHLYGRLLESDEFLNLQELVITHLGDKYMVSSPPR